MCFLALLSHQTVSKSHRQMRSCFSKQTRETASRHLWSWFYWNPGSVFFIKARLVSAAPSQKVKEAQPSMFLEFPCFGFLSESHKVSQIHRVQQRVSIISMWAYWHTCFHLTLLLTPTCDANLCLSAWNPIISGGLRCERSAWLYRWQTSF